MIAERHASSTPAFVRAEKLSSFNVVAFAYARRQEVRFDSAAKLTPLPRTGVKRSQIEYTPFGDSGGA
jgi:hypothetical protein